MKNIQLSSMISIISDNIKSGIVCFDLNGKCVYINEFAKNIFDSEVIPEIEAENYRKKILTENYNSLFEEEFKDSFFLDGKKCLFSVFYKEVFDNSGKFQGSYLKLEDKTNEIKILEKERYAATHDSITGLYNRRAFFSKANEIITKNPDVPRLLIATDIEKFKLVNDLFGEALGDEILKEHAKLLSDIKTKNSISGRVGGDKFAVLIPKADFKPEVAVQSAHKLQECLGGIKYKLHVCIGIYEIKNAEDSVESMFDKACLAIDEITGNYGLTMSYYDSNIMQKNFYKSQILSGFNEALEKKQFIIFLQPIFNCEKSENLNSAEKLVGAEVIVRWHHKDFGLLDPQNFLDILETSDEIFQMDKIVWEMAAQKLSEWKNSGNDDLSLCVNVSSKDFYFANICKIFNGLVEKYKISPKNLKLEITEKLVEKDFKLHKKVIEELRNSGFNVALDKFGSGISSLENLNKIPLDAIKIDMGFLTKEYVSEKKYKEILKNLQELTTSLNMIIVSEGVDSKKHADFLKEAGYNIFQGDFYSKALPEKLFEEQYIGAQKK